MILRRKFYVPKICCPRSIQATHTHACHSEVSIRLIGSFWFVVSKAICCGIVASCKSRPHVSLLQRPRSNDELSRFPTKKLEVPESGSALHRLCRMLASCMQKIELWYPRFGFQDIALSLVTCDFCKPMNHCRD